MKHKLLFFKLWSIVAILFFTTTNCSDNTEEVQELEESSLKLVTAKSQSSMISGYASPGTTYYVATNGDDNNTGNH